MEVVVEVVAAVVVAAVGQGSTFRLVDMAFVPVELQHHPGTAASAAACTDQVAAAAASYSPDIVAWAAVVDLAVEAAAAVAC